MSTNPDHVPQPYLSIDSYPGGYRFHFKSDSQEYQESVVISRPELDSMESVWTGLKQQLELHLWDAPDSQFPESLGGFLSKLGSWFPGDVKNLLREGKYEDLTIEVDDPLGLPWSRAQFGSESLVEGWNVCRRSNLVRTETPQGRPRALVVSNPAGLTPLSVSQQESLVEVLNTRFETEVLSGSEASVDQVKRSLSRPNSLFLASGYLDAAPLESKLLLADGELSLNDFQRELKTPQFMMLNVFVQRAFSVENLARNLLKSGCQALMIPCWSASGLTDIFTSVIETMAQGAPIAKSLRMARSQVREAEIRDTYSSHLALELWGLPDIKLPLAKERTITVQTALTTLYTLQATGPDFEIDFPVFEQALSSGKRLYLGKPGPQVNQIEIPDSTLANRVGYFEYSESGLKIVSLVPDLKINGLPVRESANFLEGDTLVFGKTRLTFKSKQDRHVEKKSTMAGLRVVVNGQEADKVFEIKENLTLVGRGTQCQLQLSDAAISRVQFVLIERKGDFFLAPVSTNPTIINGVAVNREVELLSGAEIRLSTETTLFFQQESVLSRC